MRMRRGVWGVARAVWITSPPSKRRREKMSLGSDHWARNSDDESAMETTNVSNQMPFLRSIKCYGLVAQWGTYLVTYQPVFLQWPLKLGNCGIWFESNNRFPSQNYTNLSIGDSGRDEWTRRWRSASLKHLFRLGILHPKAGWRPLSDRCLMQPDLVILFPLLLFGA